jgi:uncharacterized membrane protein
MSKRVTAKARARPEPTAAMRARRYLLIPVIPCLAVLGIVLSGIVLSVLPTPLTQVVLPVAWIGSLYHAARRSHAGWVVAMAVFFPALVGYWIYIGFRLGRT